MQLRAQGVDASANRAVSPVIGVILMVAITVILAAVIGTFVLGMTDNVDTSPPRVATTISDHDDSYAEDGYLFRIQIRSIGDDVEQREITVRVSDANSGERLAVLGESDTDAFEDSSAKLLKNGNVGSTISPTKRVRGGDILLVQDVDHSFSAGTEYIVEIVYQAEQDPEIIAEDTVTLR